MLMAGLDGIENKLNPGEPIDKNLYDLPPEELEKVPTVCGSLRQACEELDKDRAFLKKGNVFTDDAIDCLSRAQDGRGGAIRDVPPPHRVRHVLQRLRPAAISQKVGAVALMGGRPTLSPACRTFSAFPRRRGSKVPARLPQIRIVYIRQYPA